MVKILKVNLKDEMFCVGCPLFSVSSSRNLFAVRKAYCAVGSKIIKAYVENKNEVQRPAWCPLESKESA